MLFEKRVTPERSVKIASSLVYNPPAIYIRWIIHDRGFYKSPRIFGHFMERVIGFEPTTLSLAIVERHLWRGVLFRSVAN